MRGQRLFTRPIDPSDAPLIRRFLEAHSPHSEVPRGGMIGKVVGELVAVFGTSVEAGEMRLEVAVVDPALRQKRIGRFMLAELEKLARNLDVAAIVVDRAAGGEEFLRRCGFESDGVRWSRRIGD